MNPWITVVIASVGAVVVESLVLRVMFGRNRTLSQKIEAAENEAASARRQLDAMRELVEKRTENSREADREIERVENLADADLVSDANSLFPDELPDGRERTGAVDRASTSSRSCRNSPGTFRRCPGDGGASVEL